MTFVHPSAIAAAATLESLHWTLSQACHKLLHDKGVGKEVIALRATALVAVGKAFLKAECEQQPSAEEGAGGQGSGSEQGEGGGGGGDSAGMGGVSGGAKAAKKKTWRDHLKEQVNSGAAGGPPPPPPPSQGATSSE